MILLLLVHLRRDVIRLVLQCFLARFSVSQRRTPVVVVEGQAVTNGAYMYDVTPFQQRRAATASESLDVLVARVVWPSGSELHATLSSPVVIPMRR